MQGWRQPPRAQPQPDPVCSQPWTQLGALDPWGFYLED